MNGGVINESERDCRINESVGNDVCLKIVNEDNDEKTDGQKQPAEFKQSQKIRAKNRGGRKQS